ncbi:hypothetical protein DL767_011424 [Monosporascus sp. MG133]|nr:hypothetical protein DL767_011424 [Monosporascus sp. MG133]
MHVIDPASYPLSADVIYEPGPYIVKDATRFEESVGIGNKILVQPSIYGYDNRRMLDAMQILGPTRWRGVVAFDFSETSLSTLEKWHQLDVRGVRINLQQAGKLMEGVELEAVLRQYTDAIRPLNWVIQVYVPRHMIPLLKPIVPQLGVRLCIGRIGYPALPGPRSISAQKTLTSFRGLDP